MHPFSIIQIILADLCMDFKLFHITQNCKYFKKAIFPLSRLRYISLIGICFRNKIHWIQKAFSSFYMSVGYWRKLHLPVSSLANLRQLDRIFCVSQSCDCKIVFYPAVHVREKRERWDLPAPNVMSLLFYLKLSWRETRVCSFPSLALHT